METPEHERSDHHQRVCRCQCPLACGKQHKCLRDVVETVRVVREEECPQQDLFDEKDSQTEAQRDRESIVDHINTFMGYVNQLAATKFPLDDAMQAILLMCTLPDSC